MFYTSIYIYSLLLCKVNISFFQYVIISSDFYNFVTVINEKSNNRNLE